MKTANEIISILEANLAETWELYDKWKDIDSQEAHKHLVRIHTLEQVLDEIGDEPQPIAKVLATAPEKPKPKMTFKKVYINIFALLAYFTSLFFIGGFLGDLTDKIAFLDNVLGTLLVYAYWLLHSWSFLTMLVNVDLLNWGD